MYPANDPWAKGGQETGIWFGIAGLDYGGGEAVSRPQKVPGTLSGEPFLDFVSTRTPFTRSCFRSVSSPPAACFVLETKPLARHNGMHVGKWGGHSAFEVSDIPKAGNLETAEQRHALSPLKIVSKTIREVPS